MFQLMAGTRELGGLSGRYAGWLCFPNVMIGYVGKFSGCIDVNS